MTKHPIALRLSRQECKNHLLLHSAFILHSSVQFFQYILRTFVLRTSLTMEQAQCVRVPQHKCSRNISSVEYTIRYNCKKNKQRIKNNNLRAGEVSPHIKSTSTIKRHILDLISTSSESLFTSIVVSRIWHSPRFVQLPPESKEISSWRHS